MAPVPSTMNPSSWNNSAIRDNFTSLFGGSGGSGGSGGTGGTGGTGGGATSGSSTGSGGSNTSTDAKAAELQATWDRINGDIAAAEALMRTPTASVQAKFAFAMIKFAAQGMRDLQFKKDAVDARMEESKLRKQLTNKLSELENVLTTANHNGAIKDIKDEKVRTRCLKLAAEINTLSLELGYCQRVGSDGKPVPLPPGAVQPDEAKDGLVGNVDSIGRAWPNEAFKDATDLYADRSRLTQDMQDELNSSSNYASERAAPMSKDVEETTLGIYVVRVYGSFIDVLNSDSNLEKFMEAYPEKKAAIMAGDNPKLKDTVAWFDARIQTVHDDTYRDELQTFTVPVSNGISETSTIAQIRSAHTRVDNDIRTDSDYLSQDMQALSSESGRYDAIISMAKNFLESSFRDLSTILSKMF